MNTPGRPRVARGVRIRYTPPPLSNNPKGGIVHKPLPYSKPLPLQQAHTLTATAGHGQTTGGATGHNIRDNTTATIGATMSTNPRYRNGWRREQLRKRVLAAYDVCAICGQPVDKTLHTPHPLSAEVDEIIPVSRGGDPLAWDNVRLTHRRCNRLKSNRSDDYARAQLTQTPQPKATSLPLRTSTW